MSIFNRPAAPWLRNVLIGTTSILAITALTSLVRQTLNPQQKRHIAFAAEVEMNARVEIPARITLPKNAPMRAKTVSSLFAVAIKRRVDQALPGQQSWEPSIMATRADAKNAAEDEVIALWMDGRATTALTDLRIGITRSVDGGNHWATSDLAPPDASSNVSFDPMSALDASNGRAYVGAMSRNYNLGATDTVWLAARNAAASSFAAPCAG